METTSSYQVQLEVFKGPLDLLLFLIKKKKIDIHDIPIAIITKEYLEYLNHKERINLDREAEFLLMAALLIFIKSQMLLPQAKDITEEDDPRQVLVEYLLEYQKIKAASNILRVKEEEQLKYWKRTFLPHSFPQEEGDIMEVSIFSLAESFFAILKQREEKNFELIKGKDLSLEKKMKEILAVLEENSYLDFSEYINQLESVEEALISFFCLLELIKARLAIAIQERIFQSIKVWLRKDAFLKNNK